jgi:hypothetical protein
LVVAITASRATAAPGEVVRVEHRDPSALPSRGPTHALVTIEVFFTPGQASRQSGYRALEKLQADHPSRIRLVYRVLKVPGSSTLHYAALEAHAEGKFFELITELNKKTQTLTIPQLVELGRSIGLDADRLANVLRAPPRAFDKVLDANERRRSQKVTGPALPNALYNGRLGQTLLTSSNSQDLEREYQRALDLALDLIDRGADPRALDAAFEQATDPGPEEIVIQSGPIDADVDTPPNEPSLATPPLRYDGLPSYGPTGAAVTIAVLCSPTSSNCKQPMDNARNISAIYPESVRVVWAPYFDVGRDDAADLAMLADAALCAEQVGTSSDISPDPDTASAGWIWVEAARGETRHGLKRDQLIDKVAAKLKVDRRAFATCRARLAGASVAWIETARHAGVHSTPATVVGGRIYPPIKDPRTLQLLVEAELAPGVLGAATWPHAPEAAR